MTRTVGTSTTPSGVCLRRISAIGERRSTLGRRASDLAERAAAAGEQARVRVPGADAAYEAVERELARGGGLLAGGLAYRLFLWLLPIGLLGAQILGFWVARSEESVEDAAKQFGLGAAAVASAADAVETNSSNRAVLFITGLILLAWFSAGFVRALQLAYALAWDLPRPRLRKPVWAVLVFNGFFLAVALASAGLAWLRAEVGFFGILGVVIAIVFQTTVAVAVMWLLPRRAKTWRELVPGAVLVSVGAQAVSVAVVFYFAPRIGRSSELYGTLGTASVLLVWLYVMARLITSGAFLNATLWERRQRTAQATTE
jgi:membrane protein